jgi:hypothetical protein
MRAEHFDLARSEREDPQRNDLAIVALNRTYASQDKSALDED